MSKESKKLQEFKIKGELIGTINLTDTFKKVKEIVNHSDKYNFQFLNSEHEIISHFDLYKLKDNEFPITVLKIKRSEPYSGDYLDFLEEE
jgi:hypothetical protein